MLFFFNFNKDLYQKKIKIRLKKFLREEIRFENLEDLKKQIEVDVENAHQYFN